MPFMNYMGTMEGVHRPISKPKCLIFCVCHRGRKDIVCIVMSCMVHALMLVLVMSSQGANNSLALLDNDLYKQLSPRSPVIGLRAHAAHGNWNATATPSTIGQQPSGSNTSAATMPAATATSVSAATPAVRGPLRSSSSRNALPVIYSTQSQAELPSNQSSGASNAVMTVPTTQGFTSAQSRLTRVDLARLTQVVPVAQAPSLAEIAATGRVINPDMLLQANSNKDGISVLGAPTLLDDVLTANKALASPGNARNLTAKLSFGSRGSITSPGSSTLIPTLTSTRVGSQGLSTPLDSNTALMIPIRGPLTSSSSSKKLLHPAPAGQLQLPDFISSSTTAKPGFRSPHSPGFQGQRSEWELGEGGRLVKSGVNSHPHHQSVHSSTFDGRR